MKKLKMLAFVSAISLSLAAAEAQSGRTYLGCWSPYPNCAGASDIYRDSQGRLWDCGRCQTYTPNSPNCRQVSTTIYTIGYWSCPISES
jgi:hypothetical protein